MDTATDGTQASSISVRLDIATRHALERLAQDQERSVSALIRFAIRDYLAAKATA